MSQRVPQEGVYVVYWEPDVWWLDAAIKSTHTELGEALEAQGGDLVGFLRYNDGDNIEQIDTPKDITQ